MTLQILLAMSEAEMEAAFITISSSQSCIPLDALRILLAMPRRWAA